MKIKKSKLFKGMAFGVAAVLSVGFVPFNALYVLAEDVKTASLHTITVEGTPDTSVTLGEPYAIHQATYNNGSDHKVGELTSSVTVTYKNSDISLEVDTSDYVGNQNIYGTFTPTGTGTYVVKYSFTDGSDTYTYEYEVKCDVSDAYFEFDEADENLIPPVYDLSMFGEGEYKDIDLPCPRVKNDIGVEQTVKFVAQDKGVKEGKYVVVRIYDSANPDLKVLQRMTADGDPQPIEGALYIDGEQLAKDVHGTKDYKIAYTYYENGKYIASTEKTLKVAQSYYKDSASKAGYELNVNYSSDVTNFTAIAGVKKELPKVTGVTKANEHGNEEVPVSYKVEAYYGTESEPSDYITFEDGVYYLNAERKGNYRIVYTVTDFYAEEGNETHTKTVQFAIRDVRDTRQPTVFVYDANKEINTFEDVSEVPDKQKQDIKHGVYVDAEAKLKSTTGQDNIVIYAIGAVDNYTPYDDVKDEDQETVLQKGLTLKRTIRRLGSSTDLVEINDYHNYNLIFNFTTAAEFLAENNTVLRDIQNSSESVDTGNEAAVKNWLKTHGYLIVTGEEDKTVEDGYAYIKTSGSQTLDLFKDIDADATFRIVYQAKDVDNTSFTQKYIPMNVKFEGDGAFTDSKAPTITPLTLNNAYLPNERIEFSEPTASDDYDTRTDSRSLDVIKAYRFLDGTKQVKTLEQASKADKMIQADYETAKISNSGVTGKNGWYEPLTLAEGSSRYVIDLSDETVPSDVAYVELFIYTVDDYGNVGYYNKVVPITRIVADETAPTFVKVSNYDDNVFNLTTTFPQQKEITLPTLIFTDTNFEYMNASVSIYRVKNAAGEAIREVVRNNYNLNAYANTDTKNYVVNAGVFKPNKAGEYQVIVTARDSANNAKSVYFKYKVVASAEFGGVSVGNETTLRNSETIDLGEALNLPTPTFNITTDDELTGYIGIDSDGISATKYDVQIQSAPNSTKELTKTHFTSFTAGNFVLKYNIYLIQYSKVDVAESKSALGGKTLYLNDQGGISLVDSGTHYDLVIETPAESGLSDARLVAVKQEGAYGDQNMKTDIDSLIQNKVTLLTNKDFSNVEFTKEITVNYSEAPKLQKGMLDSIENDYTFELGEEGAITPITIYLPFFEWSYEGAQGIDEENSKLTVSVIVDGNTESEDTTTWKDWKWNDETEYGPNKSLPYVLDKNATYRIVYEIVGLDGTGKDTLTKEIHCGDVDAPKIELEQGVLKVNDVVYDHTNGNNVFHIGDELVLDIGAPSEQDGGKVYNQGNLKLSDEFTSDETLWNNLKISIRRTSPNASDLKFESEDDGVYRFVFDTEGTYRIRITTIDGAQLDSSYDITFKVEENPSEPIISYQTVGTILIVVASVILAGVVVYFVYSKVKSDKENKKQ